MAAQLHWLQEPPREWSSCVASLKSLDSIDGCWEQLIRLANYRLDYAQTIRLDRAYGRLAGAVTAGRSGQGPLKIAILSSSTISHLVPGIRMGALRRGLAVEVYEGSYGQYWQELNDPDSQLRRICPDVVLLSFDARHMFGATSASVESAFDRVTNFWDKARELFGCSIIQQALLPVLPSLLGNNEHRLEASAAWKVQRFNTRLRELAEQRGIHILAVDQYAAIDGIREWHEAALWNRAKQEIHPRVSPLYGDLVARLLAAQQGRSYKCLVADLDNTLWGGVIGDDGLSGISLGQGNALGEAFTGFQRYLIDLSRRGVILAVCSKNEESNALAPFTEHPEMLLRRDDISCFVANWEDKATNLRRIAQALNIGLDSLVFVDDNPAERSLVRAELPMVAVPELPEDPSSYASCISEAGYFEALTLTDEDRSRSGQYQANLQRDKMRQNATDLQGFLASLEMQLVWKHFDQVGLPRIVQLINKTNQFNLTTNRYTEQDIASVMTDSNSATFQFRLTDCFGDNGIIAVVICKHKPQSDLFIDTWLMSCRVLGRQVEQSTLNVLASYARSRSIRNLIGEFRPTAKNGIVQDHYRKLGFELLEEAEGSTRWVLDLTNFELNPTCVRVLQG